MKINNYVSLFGTSSSSGVTRWPFSESMSQTKVKVRKLSFSKLMIRIVNKEKPPEENGRNELGS